ncbi:ribosomal protein S18-alanine N-acetyltransferase [Arcanobacterium phocae]|uniref:ribosomal protein S18-alanine N-acetyltransferase n=1 Tax=Arcanobacterium phocae TaxID=131112 RepID=UPI001C0F20E5|nr:ribosomal protein S18-alanine N-acetyltransferase [Arcanobacterium phocae]
MNSCFQPNDAFPSTIAGFDLRRAPVSWAGRIADFDHQTFARDAWPSTVWEDELSASYRTYLVLSEPPGPLRSLGSIVGVGGVAYVDDAEILTIAVSPRYQRQGIGSRLLEILLDIAACHGAQRVFLEVRSKDEGVQKMYAKAGFQEISRRKHYYSDDDAVVMLRET